MTINVDYPGWNVNSMNNLEYVTKYMNEWLTKSTSDGGMNENVHLKHKANDALPNPMWGGLDDGRTISIVMKNETQKHKKFLVSVRVGVIDLAPHDIEQYMHAIEKLLKGISFLKEENVDVVYIPTFKSRETSIHVLNIETMQKVVI